MVVDRRSTCVCQGQSGQDFLACYAQLERLCQAMISELASDRCLHDSGILPQGVVLPKTAAAQYCKVVPAPCVGPVQDACCAVCKVTATPRVGPV